MSKSFQTTGKESACISELKSMHKRGKRLLQGNIFFIIGSPKSGTTWMQHLLNGHPEVCCSGEGDITRLLNGFKSILNDYNTYIEGANRQIGTSSFVLFTRRDLQHIFVTSVALLFSRIEADGKVKVLGSKDPLLAKNVHVCGSLLPRAKFIHLVRDGRDVLVSAWFNNLRNNEVDTRRRWSDFANFVKFGVKEWTSDTQTARSFGAQNPDRYIEIRYENLHRLPDSNIRDILTFLNVDASQTMVDTCRQAGSFERLSGGRRRGVEDRCRFFRKGVVGDWRNHFNEESTNIFMRHGANLLSELGYE